MRASATPPAMRAFVDDDVTGPSDPLEHLRIVELEIVQRTTVQEDYQLDPATDAATLRAAPRPR